MLAGGLGPAKGKDTCSVMGPCLVTPDEVNPRNLRMTARVNGELWSDNNSGTAYWTWPQIIEFASMEETLYPGDFLGSGTVEGGCGMELNRWIQARRCHRTGGGRHRHPQEPRWREAAQADVHPLIFLSASVFAGC